MTSSRFQEWFDAQFPAPSTALTRLSHQELMQRVIDGQHADTELQRRKTRALQEQAALYAWQAKREEV